MKTAEMLFSNAQVGLVVCKKDSTIAWCSASVSDLLDQPLDKLLHKQLSQLLSTETIRFDWKGIVTCLLENNLGTTRIVSYTKDHSTTPPLLASFHFVEHAELGNEGGISVVLQKIPDTMSCGQFIDASQTLKSLIEASPIAMVALNSQNAVTMWNHAAEMLFGWKEQEVIGKTMPSVAQDHPTEYDFHQLLQTTASSHCETQLLNRDGQSLDVGIWCAPLQDSQANLVGHVLLMMDFTEKKFLERALLDASEREQRRIGQELHDHLCQHLLGAAFAAQALSESLAKKGSKCASQLGQLARLINEAVQQTRDIARGLNPVEIDAGGLMSALQELAARVSPNISCTLSCKKPVLVADSETALHTYRIAQEAVTNASKHANATDIAIKLYEARDALILEINDNGKGISLDKDFYGGLGLEMMKYRARAIRGKLTIEKSPSGGTNIRCSLPKAT